MSRITFLEGFDGGDVVPPPARSITSMPSPASLPRASVAMEPGYPQPYARPECSSRMAVVLPRGAWKRQWTVDLEPGFPPSFVLAAGDRVLVQGERWALVGPQGNRIAGDRGGPAAVRLDPKRGQISRISADAAFVVARASDGVTSFDFLVPLGDQFRWPLLARDERRVVLAGWERTMDPHGNVVATKTLIQMYELGSPPNVTAEGFLSNISERELAIEHPHVLVATTAETIIAAEPERILVIDWALKIHAALEGEFEPHALSLDEASRAYMVVTTTRGAQLWLVAKDGQRLFAADLPQGTSDISFPPIVGYDHHTYLLAGNRVVSFDDRGRRTWVHDAKNVLAGAAVTANDHLLVVDGNDVVAFDPKGKRHLLLSLPEPLVTPPVLNEAGDLFVASAGHLYAAQVQPAASP
jgi:hypothetical protein